MKEINPFKSFGKYVLRTPMLSVNFYLDLTKEKRVSDEKFFAAFQDKVVKEALFTASPNLYKELELWAVGELKDEKRIGRLRLSFLKYLTRMSTRCTPFGLFAGISTGTFEEDTRIELTKPSEYRRYSRLDHEVVIRLAHALLEDETVRNNIRFAPNTSMHFIGEQIRYVEVNYSVAPREHKIVSIGNNYLISEVLKFSKKGVTIRELVQFISNDNIDKVAALGFVNNIVTNQILVSELEANNVGKEYFHRILAVLDRIGYNNANLKLVLDKVLELDGNIGNKHSAYDEVFKMLPFGSDQIDKKGFIKTDLFPTTHHNTVDKKVERDLLRGLNFLNKIGLNDSRKAFPNFIKGFQQRYGERRVELAKVLDKEMGISFLQDTEREGIAPLLDDIMIPIVTKSVFTKEELRRGDCLLMEKSEGLQPGDILNLTDDDLNSIDHQWQDYKLDWSKTHDTIASIVEIVEDQGERKYIMNGAWGPSGGNWIARFGFGDKALNELIQDIATFEQNAATKKDVVLAEVSYLPKKPAGGVVVREDFRDYEIPYLTHSDKPSERQILLEDLSIYVENGVLKLWSKRLDKQIEPKVTDAHYFDYGSLPFYHFLCEMPFQGKRLSCSFVWSRALREVRFLPRVEYRNIIFRLAYWRVFEHEVRHMFNEKDDDKFFNSMKSWQEKIQLPQFVKLVEGDKELVINFNNLTSLRMLISAVKEETFFQLTEFLFAQDGVVKREGEHFVNELMIPFYNSEKI